MSGSSEIALNCIEDIGERLGVVEHIGTRIFSTYSEEDLKQKTKLIQYPAVGIIYSGTQANGRDDQQGLNGTVNLSLVLLINNPAVANLELHNQAAKVLDQMRVAIRRFNNPGKSRSPSGHMWRFVSEMPAGNMGNILVFLQRWSTMVPLTP